MTPKTNSSLDVEEPVVSGTDFDLEKAIADAESDGESFPDGEYHISEDVIRDIAKRAMGRASSVLPAKSSAVLGIGRSDGIKVTMIDEGDLPMVSVDAFVLVRYGLRIPDVAWDLQELLKNELERSTGYEVKSVNIFVQGVYFGDKQETAGTQAENAS